MPTPSSSGVPPEHALVGAAILYAGLTAGAVLSGLRLFYTDGRSVRLSVPSGYAPPVAPVVGICPKRVLSQDGRRICRAIADRQPIATKAIIDEAGVERTKLYMLVADLVDRGVLAETGDGLVIGDTGTWDAVRQIA